jgi:hypothetical protein
MEYRLRTLFIVLNRYIGTFSDIIQRYNCFTVATERQLLYGFQKGNPHL